MEFDFSSDFFNILFEVVIIGISSGFTLGFFAWGIGFAIHAVSKFFKMSTS